METTLRLHIEGMVCGGCVRTVCRALEALPGVRVEYAVPGKPVEIRLDETQSDRSAVEAAIAQAGFRPVAAAPATQPEG